MAKMHMTVLKIYGSFILKTGNLEKFERCRKLAFRVRHTFQPYIFPLLVFFLIEKIETFHNGDREKIVFINSTRDSCKAFFF